MNDKEVSRIFKRYGNLPITNALLAVIKNHDDEKLLEHVMYAIEENARRLLELVTHGHKVTDILHKFYEANEEITDYPPSTIQCRKGCAFCCHINVTISQAEAELIQEYCNEHGMKIDWQRFKDQRKLTEQTHASSEYKKCAFLKDNQCSVYEVRPFNCRNYFVITPAFLCDADKFPKGTVGTYVNVEKEVLHSAFILMLNKLGLPYEQDSMARTFLNLKKIKDNEKQ